jgi:hypothetical protein
VLPIIAAIAFVALSANARAADPDPAAVKQVQDDVKLLRQGVFRVLSKSEIETALTLMHPKIIEAVGGIEKARANATSESRRQATSLFSIEKVEFLQAPEFFSGKEHEFVFVPVAMTMSRVDRTRNQSFTFYLGGRKKGDTAWKYVEAPKLLQDKGSAYFTDFPDGKQFPPIFTRKLK